jgi:hypothetical protein
MLRGKTRGKVGALSALGVAVLTVSLYVPTIAKAADGTILRTITAQNYNCPVGTGIAFDGTNLLLSCDSSNVITAVNPTDGSFVRSYTISGVPALGAMAWDRGRQALWSCGGFSGDDTIVYQVNLDTQTATQAFGGTSGCPDGLAFDGTDDTLYLSADVATTVQHYKADGTLIANIDVTNRLGGCGNSGIAIGGGNLFLANNGCSQIYKADKTNIATAQLFGTYPARLEDMECDDLTFLSSGKAAIWSKDAYDGILNAFELNVGDCGFGGLPSGSGNADSDGDGLPDSWETQGVDVNHDGVIDLDLKAMGADPQHKDIFIEADWMNKPQSCIWFICWGGKSYAPMRAALDDVVSAFAASPVTNPDGTTGVRVHIDSGSGSIMNPVTYEKWGTRSRASDIGFTEKLGSYDATTGYQWASFDSVRTANFSVERRNVFHYLLYADMYAGAPLAAPCDTGTCSSGISRGIPASDTIVSDGDPSWKGGFSRIQERGTVMHELGHNLNLRHGGGDDSNYKPGYLSIMNYDYQLIGLPPSAALDYSRGAPFVDWDHLVFTGGAVGAFGTGTLPAATPVTESTLPTTISATGDGTLRFVSPRILFANTGTKQLLLSVTNIGMQAAPFTVAVSIPGIGLTKPSASVTVPAGQSRQVSVPVSTSSLTPGQYTLTVTLSSPLGVGLSSDSATITVPNLSDLTQRQQARAALKQLKTDGATPGMDKATREALIAALEQALGRDS